jgi:sulfatase maturation enzyme AslB (radical SAM superfamily)
MDLSSFTFIMTNDCHFSCSYCYQKKGKKYLDLATAKKAADFFLPALTRDCSVNFYGGEPLLAFARIKELFNFIQDKNGRLKKMISYSISTNGDVLDDETIRFLDEHRFHVLLSFDGLAQDVSRKRGSFAQIVPVLEKLLRCSGVDLEINSVFTAQTVEYLYPSVKFIIETGVKNADVSFANHPSWNTTAISRLGRELSKVRRFLVPFSRERGFIPVSVFRKTSRSGLFGCSAGKDRMALSPDGRLWGCCLFYDFYRKKENKSGLKYCFGSLESFMKNQAEVQPQVLDNYSHLTMKHFFTSENFCALCEEVDDCSICPVDAALASSVVGKISDWDCAIRKSIRRERTRFLEALEIPVDKSSLRRNA